MENTNNLAPENAEPVNINNLVDVDEKDLKPVEENANANTSANVNVNVNVNANPQPTAEGAPTSGESEPEEPFYVNTSGAEYENVMFFTITQDDVTRHFAQKIINLPITADYQRWDGAKDNAYVLMRVAIPVKLASQKLDVALNNPYMEQQLAQNNNGTYMSQDVLDRISPYMYPSNMADVNLKPEVVDYLTRIGLTAERYNKYILDYVDPRLARDPETGVEYFVLVLQADEIIQHMINVDPRTNEKYGKFEIVAVSGGESVLDTFGRPVSATPISWKCIVDVNKDAIKDAGHVPMTELFQNAQPK